MTNKMTMNDMIMLSVDDHAIEPPDLFLGRMPAKYKDETPRVAQYANGDERWVVQGKGKAKELRLAIIRAHNDWHIEDWAGRYPARLIPNGILPLWDVDLAVAELRRIRDAGCRVVSFPENPTGFGQPSVHWGHWDRLFAEIVERDMAVAGHICTRGRP